MMFLETIQNNIKTHELITQGATVLIAVSGGADSLALLYALHQISKSHPMTLHVATYNHGWRGESAKQDVDFVVAHAQSLNLTVHVGEATSQNARPMTEAEGRRLRYDFLAQTAKKIQAHTIAVGHHQQDQAETLILRLIRGTAVDGLAGMSFKSAMPYHPDFTLIRPLLSISRADIEAYCNTQHLTPRHDPTNNDTRFRRNWVRHELLPQLEQYNPNIVKALSQLSDLARQDADYIQQEMMKLLHKHAKPMPNGWQLDRDTWLSWHPTLQSRALMTLVQRLYPHQTGDVDYKHITAASHIAKQGQQGAIAQFPNHITMRVQYDMLLFSRGESVAQTVQMTSHTPIQFNINQWVNIHGGKIGIYPEPPLNGIVLSTLYLPANVALTLRTRQQGEKIQPAGLDGQSQKLSDWMINRKIPANQREYLPILVHHDSIVAIIHPALGTTTHFYHSPTQIHPYKYYLILFLDEN